MEADEEMAMYGEEEYEIPEEYHHGEEESEEIQHHHNQMFSPHSSIKRQSLNVVVGPSSSQENALTRPPFGEDGDNDEDEDTTYFAEEYHFGDIFAAVKTRHLLATSAPKRFERVALRASDDLRAEAHRLRQSNAYDKREESKGLIERANELEREAKTWNLVNHLMGDALYEDRNGFEIEKTRTLAANRENGNGYTGDVLLPCLLYTSPSPRDRG